MSGYVLQRIPDGAFVARPGSRSSYVRALQLARVFQTPEAAERERCPENERLIAVADLLRPEA